MKKIILTLVMIASAMSSFAQYEKGTVSICPQVGLTGSQVITTTHDDWKRTIGESRYRLGFTAGAEVEYMNKSWMGLSAGAFYNQQGARGYHNDINLKYDYVTVPVLANFYPCKHLCLKVGLQPAFNVNAKATQKGEPFEGFGADGIRKFDLQVPVGVSFETKGFIVDARYAIGTINMLKYGDFGNKCCTMNNSTFTLTVGYKFHL